MPTSTWEPVSPSWESATPLRCTSALPSSGTRSRTSIRPSSHRRSSACLGRPGDSPSPWPCGRSPRRASTRRDVAQLEAPLPELTARDLLPEQFSRSAATRDLLRGLVVAGAALLISDVLASRHLGGSLKPGSAVIAGTAVVTGAVAFAGDRRHPDIPGNVVANAQRRAERAGQNAAIKGRNTAKTAATVLLVTPAAGVGP